jgi:two-component system, OmpR family, sensor histidine kinase KdpD
VALGNERDPSSSIFWVVGEGVELTEGTTVSSTPGDPLRISLRALRLLASIAGVAVITFIASSVIRVNATTVGFAYLLYVLLIASTWGFLEASIASVAATLASNFFFFPPVGTFTIADPENWVALFTFLATSLIGSRLSTIARRRASDAVERQQDLERLYTFGRAILLINSGEPFAKQLTKRLAEAFELNAAALYEPQSGEIYRAGPADLEGVDNQLREAALQGTAFSGTEGKHVITAVRLGSKPIASLALQGERMSDSVVQSIANLVAIGLERAKAQELAHEIEAARRSERLRTTLIDAMAHEFKTPLTSIRAATTALLANSEEQPSNAARMLKIADEEAARLEELIDNALDLAQLESDRIDLDLEISNLGEVVREVFAATKSEIGDRALDFVCDEQLPALAFDRRLVKLAIKQVFDNAAKYSPSGTPIGIRTIRINGTVAIEITDHGNGISAQEQVRIFERFYRSPSVQERIPGSGLGLSIAHRIMQAHGGDLTVRSQPGETTFSLVLPIERKGEGD